MDYRARYRSLFWPVILVGVGVIWLLSNLGYVTPANLSEIWRLWPLLLIAAGLDMLLGRRLPLASALIGLLVLGLVGAFLFADIRIPGTGADRGRHRESSPANRPGQNGQCILELLVRSRPGVRFE